MDARARARSIAWERLSVSRETQAQQTVTCDNCREEKMRYDPQTGEALCSACGYDVHDEELEAVNVESQELCRQCGRPIQISLHRFLLPAGQVLKDRVVWGAAILVGLNPYIEIRPSDECVERRGSETVRHLCQRECP